jgi:hypothetical protein
MKATVKLNDVINHETFGEGYVVESDDLNISVRFKSNMKEKKSLLREYAECKIIVIGQFEGKFALDSMSKSQFDEIVIISNEITKKRMSNGNLF